MTHVLARIGAVVATRVEDCHPDGKRRRVRLRGKGGERRAAFLDEHPAAAGIRDDGKAPCSARRGRTGAPPVR